MNTAPQHNKILHLGSPIGKKLTPPQHFCHDEACMFQFKSSALPERIRDLIYIEPNSGCWLWLGPISIYGYAQRSGPAHRQVWKLCNGEALDNQILHHWCKTKCCVNPSHLVVTTRSQHKQLHETPELKNGHSYQTHCKRGHLLIENKIERDGIHRRCRICKKLTDHLRRSYQYSNSRIRCLSLIQQ